MRSLLSISAKNFLSLREVDVPLNDLSVLVGPNGAGKSNLLRVVQFLGDTARLDLGPAIDLHGGFSRLRFRGESSAEGRATRIELGVTGLFTPHSSVTAPDVYRLRFGQLGDAKPKVRLSHRSEEFVFKRTQGRGRRITVSGSKVSIQRDDAEAGTVTKEKALANTSAGLSTLPRLGAADGGEQINMLAGMLTTFRVFEVNVPAARTPTSGGSANASALEANAANLAAFLQWLRDTWPDTFAQYVEDLRFVAPSVQGLNFVAVGGPASSAVAVRLKERGLHGETEMSEASFGTIRAMALLAMLHDPHPPRITCVEEIDHGLHPNALDRLVERMRDASLKTQLLVATHSPALANRLLPEELIVCERDVDSGASRMPAISAAEMRRMTAASNLGLGELWFSGALGGAP
jgi:predicted ATPase